MKKLTKKQKNMIIRIVAIIVLAVLAYFFMPEDESGNNGNTGNHNGTYAENVTNTPDAGKEDDNAGDENDASNDEGDTGNPEGNNDSTTVEYQFRKDEYLEEHFEKHGSEFNYETAEEYLAGANRVLNSEGVLHKTEAEDGDDVYYLESTNELVVVSTDGYIRTYFKPSAGIDYFNRQ